MESLFRAIVEAAPNGMVVADLQGHIRLVNRRAEEIFGYEAGELNGASVETLVPDDRRDRHSQIRNEYEQAPEPRHMTGRGQVARRKDGSTFLAEIGLNPIETEEGPAILASVVDVSAQKRAEAEREALLLISKAALESGTLADFLAGVEQAVHTVVGGTFSVFQQNRSTGMLEAVYPAGAESRAARFIAQNGRTRILSQAQFDEWLRDGSAAITHPTGPAIWIGVPLRAGANELGVMTLHAAHDSPYQKNDLNFFESIRGHLEMAIERLESRAALLAAETRYRQLVEQIPAVMYSAELGIDAPWHFVSPQIMDLLGYSAEEWITDASFWQRALHPDDRALVEEVESRASRSGQTVEMEYRLFRRDGRMIWVRDQAIVTRNEAGTPFLSLGFLFDITRNKLAEEEIHRRANEFALLYQTAHDMTESQQDLPAILNVIASRAASLLDTTVSGIYLWDEAANVLELAVRVGELFPPAVRLPPGQGASGLAAQDRRSVIVDNYSGWTNRSSIFTKFPIGPVLAVPMLAGGALIGVLTVGEVLGTSRRFNENDAHLLELFASHAASAVSNARLMENTMRRLNELESLSRVSAALRVANSLDEMLPRLLDETLQALDTTSGSIFLQDAQTNALAPRIQRGWYADARRELAQPGQSVAERIFQSGDIFHTGSSEVAADVPSEHDTVCVPIETSLGAVGVLFVSVRAPREISADEIRLLTTLAGMAGNSIHRMSLYEQTERSLSHLSILRQIDQTIASNFDLSVSLNVVINHALAHLQADAVSILRLDAPTQSLDYFLGRGFYNEEALRRGRLRLGANYAGLAALERRPISIPDLGGPSHTFASSEFAQTEHIRAYHAMPLIAKGVVKGVLEVIHRAPFHPGGEWLDLLETLAGQAALAIDNAALFDDLQQSNQELVFAYDTTIEGWSRALDLRDRETEGHTQRVTELTLRLAGAFGLKPEEIVHIRRGALLHDIGKMGVPDQILLKPGPLSVDEWRVMRQHPVYAYQMLAPIHYLRPALDIPYCHHEKWDGSGYPRGLKGEEIPLAARLFSVVDVWDALLSNRPYRPAWSSEKTLRYLRDHSGRIFDPRAVETFINLVAE